MNKQVQSQSKRSIPVRKIRVPEEPARRFSIRKVGDILNGAGLQHKLHRHEFYFILLVSQGRGLHEIDFQPHPVSHNMVFLLRPGQVHQLQLEPGASGYLLEFDPGFYYPMESAAAQRLRKAVARDAYTIVTPLFQRLETILSEIHVEFVQKQEGYLSAIGAGLDLFFIGLVRSPETTDHDNPAPTAYTQNRFGEFTTLLEQHYATHKQVSDYTRFMSLSSYQLNGITKAMVGKTASTLIEEHILLEAKRYLLATPQQVKEIADMLGYEDPSYFIRFFKKHTGHSPEAFRKK